MHGNVEIRFTFAFALNMSKIASDIVCPQAETRGLGPQCRAGSRLSSTFIYNIYTDRRIAAHANTCRANRAGPYDVRPRYNNIFRKEVFLVNLEHSSCILQKGGVPWVCLACAELHLETPFFSLFRKEVFLVNLEPLFLHSSERRCSSRTFRYGYLVTT